MSINGLNKGPCLPNTFIFHISPIGISGAGLGPLTFMLPNLSRNQSEMFECLVPQRMLGSAVKNPISLKRLTTMKQVLLIQQVTDVGNHRIHTWKKGKEKIVIFC